MILRYLQNSYVCEKSFLSLNAAAVDSESVSVVPSQAFIRPQSIYLRCLSGQVFFQNSHRGPSIPPAILLNYHLSTFSHHSEIKVSQHPGFNVRILRSSAPLEIAEYEK